MRPRAARLLAWSCCALTVGLWVAGLLLHAASGGLGSGGAPKSAAAILLTVAWVATLTLIAVIGALIASRHPENAIGWLTCAAGLSIGFSFFAFDYAAFATAHANGAGAAGVLWVGRWLGTANAVLIAPVLLLFPNGRLPSRRWRAVVWLALAAAVAGAAGAAFRPGLLSEAPPILNPFGVEGARPLLGAVRLVAAVGLGASVLLAAAALGLRLRRARGEERQQLKWIAAAAVPWALAFAAGSLAPPAWSLAGSLAYVLALAAFNVAVALAVLRRRLYDVDLVLNKAVVYAVLAAFVTGAYAALVAGAGVLVGAQGAPAPWLPLAATAAVAVAFQPVRERAQRLANRLVYGRRASPYEVLAGFSHRVAGALSVEEVLPRLAEAAARGVGAARGRARLFLPGGAERAAWWPEAPPAATAARLDHTVPVVYEGERVGDIAVAAAPDEPLSPAGVRLLADLGAQAGLALRNARLTLELRARLEELASQAEALRASRQRIAVAQDGARRRLERDLHDGAQQHLVALAVTARLARQLVDEDPRRAAALLDDLADQATGALATLRDLARGIFPAVLADRGLAAALTAHVARTCPATRIDGASALDGARFPPAVEAGVYFCCLEALQNAAKHAPGAPVTLRLGAEDAGLVFSVRDEGPGFDSLPPGATTPGDTGAGLLNMGDRMAALGGTLSIATAPGRGTTVTGRAPLPRVPLPAAAESRPEVRAAVAGAPGLWRPLAGRVTP